jgi:hypothetical protein
MLTDRSWTFEQATGDLLDPSGNKVATGYAGRDAGKNNPDMQDVKGIGPLPRGTYYACAPADDRVVGAYAMRLTPSVNNDMFGRNSFFLHGDSVEHPGLASHGCIVFPRALRERFWSSGDHTIEVVHG